MLRAGALRFWISRLWDLHLPREASMLKPHDPTHFERVRQRVRPPGAGLSLCAALAGDEFVTQTASVCAPSELLTQSRPYRRT
jgi:hypothetical protein